MSHVVYGAIESADRSTGLPHFGSKWRIKERIRAFGRCSGSSASRPADFHQRLAVREQPHDGRPLRVKELS